MRMDARRDAKPNSRTYSQASNDADTASGATRSTSPRRGRRPEGRAISGRFVVARPWKVLDLPSDSTPRSDLEVDPSHAPGNSSEAPKAGARRRRARPRAMRRRSAAGRPLRLRGDG